MKKLIIFDLDGTILNTLKDITNSINYMLNKFKMPLKDEQEIKYYLGRGPKYLIEKAVNIDLNDKLYNELYEVYDKHYAVHKNDFTKPYKGFDEVFNKLKSLGYLLAVCSNKQESATVELINTLFPNIFDVVMGTTEKYKAKPSSDMIEYIIESLKIDKKNVLYIGDTEIDMQTAINSKIEKIAVLYGFRKKEELEVYKPYDYVTNPTEIVNIVEKYFHKR